VLSYLYYEAKVFNQPTALRAVASLRSLISRGVLGTVRSSISVMRCLSCWITSPSCATYCGTFSLVLTSMTVIERSALLTCSFTSSFYATNWPLLCCSATFSSSHFAYREIFYRSVLLHCVSRSSCACAKSWVACVVSSWAHWRRASTLSVI